MPRSLGGQGSDAVQHFDARRAGVEAEKVAGASVYSVNHICGAYQTTCRQL